MRIDREVLLMQLESVLPGLSPKEMIEQSSCFIFKNKKVITYNDEIGCSQNSCLDIEGAIPAMPFISILRKLKEETIEIVLKKKSLKIKGKKKEILMEIEAEILLPIEDIEQPKKWKSLPTDFADAIALVKECAGTDKAEFTMTCIHITPKWIEASDDIQIARYMTKTDLKKPILIRKESLKHIISLDMTEFSETRNWIHFKNSTGLILSCQRFVEEYPNATSILKTKGKEINFPKGLKETIERANIFSSENLDENRIELKLSKGKLKIIGEGVTGRINERKKMNYTGKAFSFTISPKLLETLILQHTKFELSEKYLSTKMGKFRYITVLGINKDKDN